MITQTQDFKGFAKERPSGNTALKCQSIGIGGALNSGLTVSLDWITVTFKPKDYKDFRECCDYVADFFNDAFTFYPERGLTRGKWWASTGRSAHGAIVGYNFPSGESKPGEAMISLNPKVLNHAKNQRSIWRMCRGLAHTWRVNCSRIDVALDDFEKTISYEMMVEACEAGNYARVDMFDPIPGKLARGVKILDSSERGWTIYLGSRRSEKFLRYYNKSVESDGEIDSYRLEVEFKGYKAHQVFYEYVGFSPESFEELCPVALANYVVGAIDFVDRESGDRLQRQVRLSWWEEFISKIGQGIRVLARRSKPSIAKKVDWVKHSVETSLALIQDGLGKHPFEAFIKSCLESGRKRYKKEHETLLRVFRSERYANQQYIGVENDLLFGIASNC